MSRFLFKIPTPQKMRPFRYVYKTPVGRIRRGEITTQFESAASGGDPKVIRRVSSVKLVGSLRSGRVIFNRTVYAGSSKDPVLGTLAGGSKSVFNRKEYLPTRSSRVRLGRSLRKMTAIPERNQATKLKTQYGPALRGFESNRVRAYKTQWVAQR